MEAYHSLLHWITHQIGHHLGEQSPEWLHIFVHALLFWMPLALLTLLVLHGIRRIRRSIRANRDRTVETRLPYIPGLPGGFFAFIKRYSWRSQIILIASGLLAMPILYATLELPKTIVNNAIDSDHFPLTFVGQEFSQTSYLFMLCLLFLTAILVNGAIKYWINVYKGRVGERLLRRLRLTVFRRWRGGAGGTRRSEVIPIIIQEVEPVGGFAADAFALPAFQGGTFITILTFMFVQDPVLGAAAVSLLPIQLMVIPRLQRKVNQLARRRVGEVRNLGGHLGDQAAEDQKAREEIHIVGASLKRIESIRWEIHRSKYFIKSLNNFLTALTPFFFYSIGGYLVIEGELSLGALVAVLTAHKDFSAPLRELFRYYQTVEDVRIRYGEVGRFLTGSIVPASDEPKAKEGRKPLLEGLSVARGARPDPAFGGG